MSVHLAKHLDTDEALPANPLAEAIGLLRDIRTALAERRLDDRLAIDAEELAAALGVSERSVWTMNSAGELPEPFKAGKRTLWDVSDLRAWMRSNRPDREEWERIKRKAK